MKSKLLPFKDEIIKLYVHDNQTCAQIGLKFNLRPGAVGAFLRKNNISLRKKGKRQIDNIAFIIKSVESQDYKTKCDAYIRKIIREYLILKKGNKCMICGLTKWGNIPIPLVCDHIDGNSKNVSLDNFRIICNNCDATLPTFKGRNRGKGRQNLRKDG